METLSEYWPFLIPLIVIQFGLLAAALIHVFRHNKYRVGNRVLWVIVCLCTSVIGPVLYFVIGKGDE
ncbi:PLDc N-terminal domain-containing protein [Candidatus Saccharibacteria bacterium]|nr:PLDc N-terminal domain-containing protein [Candidatus Saccharibacteria bacterium]